MTETDRAATPNGPWLRQSRRTAYENPWITIWHDEVSRPDGSPGIYGLVHFANLAVGVVVLDEDDRETPIDGMKRELREETGVEASEWRELVRLHLSNSVTDEAGVLYLARGLSHGASEPEPTERIEVRWVAFEEALAMTVDGRITDAMSLIGLQRVALERASRHES
jgi:hypothetical protein